MLLQNLESSQEQRQAQNVSLVLRSQQAEKNSSLRPWSSVTPVTPLH